jgi:membrane protein DedA with SNARE-associated domain
MPIVPFLVYSTIGTLAWVALLTYAGYLLGANYGLIEQYLGPVSKFVLVALVVAFGTWLFLKQRQRESRG